MCPYMIAQNRSRNVPHWFDMASLDGKVVLITGASGGLGAAVTQAFLAAGGSVVVVASKWPNPPEGTTALGADLSSEAGCTGVVSSTLDRFGRVDALMHLVGGFAGGSSIEATPLDEFDRMMTINFRTALNMLRAVLPPMKERESGTIAMIGSKAAVDMPDGLAAYNASKAAMVALVRTAAAECKKSGVTVNAVLPSTIATPAMRADATQAEAAKWVTPESIAELLIWLCGPAGRDVTGALLPMYGRL